MYQYRSEECPVLPNVSNDVNEISISKSKTKKKIKKIEAKQDEIDHRYKTV